MTAAAENSTRTNAAGEKYSLRGIYGSEPYWPEAKLKICVTGAGGFIGASFSFRVVLINLLVSLSRRGKAVAVETPARFGVRARLEKERARKP